MKRPKRLSATFIKTVRRPGRYGDGRGGHGLSLLVKPRVAGGWSKSWAQRLRIDGRLRNLGLGSYPVVTLARARRKALANRRAVEEGRNPLSLPAKVPTFREATDKTIAIHARAWKPSSRTEKQWRSLFKRYVYPSIGDRAVSKVLTGDLLAILAPLAVARAETARKLRQRLSLVFRWAVAKGHRASNPAGEALTAALPRNNGKAVKHHRALPHAEVTGAIAKVRACEAWAGTRLAFEFLVLTAGRSGEVRGARWGEIDENTATWTVPASRMKAKRPHRVPLSQQALNVLARARGIADRSGLVFPSVTGRQQSDNTVSKLLRDQGIRAVPHGFRSSFRDWCGETGQPREVAEASLAHVVRNRTEAAYARSDLFARRRDLIQKWGDYLSRT